MTIVSWQRRLGVTVEAVEGLLRGLSDMHGVVLHPHVCAPWILHPFSRMPTMHWIEGKKRGWWAPCVRCAFGVAALVGGEVVIHTRIGAESDRAVIGVKDGQPVGDDEMWVHFAIPPARVREKVHLHCALVLPVRSREGIAEWCRGHRLPRGEAVPLRQVADLAGIWYGRHAERNWRMWSVAEAQQYSRRRDSRLRSGIWVSKTVDSETGDG